MYRGSGATTPGAGVPPNGKRVPSGPMSTGRRVMPNGDLIAAVGALYDAGESRAKIAKALGMGMAKVETCISWYLLRERR